MQLEQLYEKEVSREICESKYKHSINVISGSAWPILGLKPRPEALIYYLNKGDLLKKYVEMRSRPVKIAVCGDSPFNDVLLGLNLEKRLENNGFASKVSVSNILFDKYNIYEKFSSECNDKKFESLNYLLKRTDFSVNNLSKLHNLIKSESYDFVFCDGDNTLWKFCLSNEKKVKYRSKTGSISDKLGVGAACFTFFSLPDFFYALLQTHPRSSWAESESNLKWFLESVSTLPTLFTIATQSNFVSVKNLFKKYNVNVKLNKPYFL